MSCEINNIQDPTLKRLISSYGEEGIKTYLNLVAPIVSRFELNTSVDKSTAMDAVGQLIEYSNRTGENHSYELNGKVVSLQDIMDSTASSFNLKLKIDFASKYLDQKYQYSKESKANEEEEFSDDPEVTEEDPIESEVMDDVNETYYEETEETDSFTAAEQAEAEMEFDDEPSFGASESEMEEYTGELGDVYSNILEDDYDLEVEWDSEVAFEEDVTQDEVTKAFFGTDPVSVNLKQGMNSIIRRVKGRQADVAKLITKVKNDIRSIESQIALLGKNPTSSARLTELTQKLQHHQKNLEFLNTKVAALAANKTIANLDAMYERNAAWINSIIRSENPSPEELMAAVNAIAMWQDIRNVFGKQIHLDSKMLKGLLEIQKKSFNPEFDKLHSKVLPGFIRQVGKDLFGMVMPESSTAGTSDIGSVGAYTLGLAHYSDKPIVNFLHKLLTDASRKSNNEFFDASNKISAMFQKLKDNKLDYRDILSFDENGKWDGGIIARFTKSYHNFRSKIDSDFVEAMNDIKYGNKEGAEGKMYREVLKRSEKIKQNVYTINPKSIATETGKTKVLAELTRITGDSAFAEKLITEAQAKYDAWGELNDNLIKREEEHVAGGKSEEESDAFLSEFKKNTSPQEYYDYVYNNGASAKDIRMFHDVDKYLVEVPLRTGKSGNDLKTYDSRYQSKIQSNPLMQEFYDAHATELNKYVSYLPGYAARTIDGTFVPNVRKALMNKLLKNGIRNVPATLKGKLMDAVTSRNGMQLEFLDEDGNPRNTIPLRYIREIDLDQKSDDLQENLMEFAKMAIAYKHLSAVEDYALLVKSMLNDPSFQEIKLKADGSVDVINTNKSKGGKDQLQNLRKLVDHVLNNVLYNKSSDKEGVVEKKFYDPNKMIISISDPNQALHVIGQFNELVGKIGLEAAMNKMVKKYPTIVKIESEKIAGEKILKMIDELEWAYQNDEISKGDYEYRLSIYKQFTDSIGANFVWSQAGDVAITWGAYKVFSYNPFPAVTNIGFGMVQMMSHASGRADFTPREAINGIMHAMSSLKATVKNKDKANNKLYNIAMRNGLLPEHYGGDSGSNGYSLGALSPMGLLSEGDYILRVSAMDAMMHHTKMKDLNGKERPLIDAFNNDGTYNEKEFGKNEDWGPNAESLTGGKEILSFMNKVKFVNQFLHGNMSKESAIMLKRGILGRLVSQYRMSWLADGVYSRFAPRQSLGVLERDFEGTYRTTYNFLAKEGVLSGTMQLGKAFAKVLMFRGESSFDGIKVLPKDRELFVSNMRKQFAEMKILLMLTATFMLLSASMDDDDKETKRWKYLIMNNINNMIKDITFFISPYSFKSTTDNLIPALGLMEDYRKLMTTVGHHMAGDPYYNTEKVTERILRTFPVLNVYYKYDDRSTGLPQVK